MIASSLLICYCSKGSHLLATYRKGFEFAQNKNPCVTKIMDASPYRVSINIYIYSYIESKYYGRFLSASQASRLYYQQATML